MFGVQELGNALGLFAEDVKLQAPWHVPGQVLLYHHHHHHRHRHRYYQWKKAILALQLVWLALIPMLLVSPSIRTAPPLLQLTRCFPPIHLGARRDDR